MSGLSDYWFEQMKLAGISSPGFGVAVPQVPTSLLPSNFGQSSGGPSTASSASKSSILDQSSGVVPYQGAVEGGAGVIGGIADLVGSKNRINKQQGLYDEAMRLRGVTRGKQDDFKFGIAQAQRDLATAGIRPTDTSYIQSGLATSLGSMNDPRQFGNVNSLLGQTLEAERKAKEGDLNRELSAMSNLANLEQQVLSQNQAKDFNLLAQDSQEQFADATMAAQNKMQLEQDRRNAFANIASGAVQATVSGFTGAQNGGRVKYEEGGRMNDDPFEKYVVGGFLDTVGGAMGEGLIESISKARAKKGKDTKLFGITADELNQGKGLAGGSERSDDEITITVNKNGVIKNMQEGGRLNEDVMMRILEEQRPVQKTEGEFNHDTNKKAIIDEETGVKEGEATGGEYILNPEQGEAIKVQYDEIARMIEEGSEPSMEELQNLYDAVHEVFSQPQFNEA